MEYSCYYKDRFVQVYDLDKALIAIKVRDENNKAKIARLEEENAHLKNEAYKDEELIKMKEELKKARKDCSRGFPISEEEMNCIESWQQRHDAEKHGLKSAEDKLNAGGAIGGRYSFEFIPTSIGVVGTVKCTCGDSFTFQEL